jgi:hypothetical protein
MPWWSGWNKAGQRAGVSPRRPEFRGRLSRDPGPQPLLHPWTSTNSLSKNESAGRGERCFLRYHCPGRISAGCRSIQHPMPAHSRGSCSPKNPGGQDCLALLPGTLFGVDPPAARVSGFAETAGSLLESQVLPRFQIVCLREDRFRGFIQESAREGVRGGPIYNSHIADIARLSGARVVVTGNRRHFASLLPYGIRVLTPEEFVAGWDERP